MFTNYTNCLPAWSVGPNCYEKVYGVVAKFGKSAAVIGGKTALSVVYTMDLDYTGMGVDLQTNVTFVQAIVSEDAIGTYTFTIASDSMDGCQPLVEVVNTVVWAE